MVAQVCNTDCAAEILGVSHSLSPKPGDWLQRRGRRGRWRGSAEQTLDFWLHMILHDASNSSKVQFYF